MITILWAIGAVVLGLWLQASDRKAPMWTAILIAALWPLVLVLGCLDEMSRSEFRP